VRFLALYLAVFVALLAYWAGLRWTIRRLWKD